MFMGFVNIQEMVAEAERKSKCTTKRSNHENEYIPRARDPHHERLMRRRVAAAAAAATSARMIMIGRRRRPSTNPDPFYYFSATDSSPSVGATTAVTRADVRSRSIDFMAFSGSLKSKLTTASVRYKESFSKGTRSLKAKIIARNDSMKELSKGVQREMSAGIAGIARLISRKRSGISSTSARGASRSRGERSVEDDSIVESLLMTNGS